MRIDSLLLKGYKPLLVNGHNEFEIHFQSIYQLLIGTNGSGKSSVMRELSPMPAYSGDFIKGGSKIIKLPHRGKYYILTSDFTTGNKHSFLVDDVEENPGGTYTVQKELVHSHFGLSEELHSILTDSLRFTRMTPQKRSEWIIRLSGGDLGYAMHVFQQLKSRARDQVGVVKHLNARLNQETDKLASDDRLEENVALCHTLKNELTWMMESKDVTIKDNERIITGRMINALTDVTNLSNEVIKANIKRPHFIAKVDIEDISDVDRILADLKAEQTANDGLYKHYAEEHHKVSDIIHALVHSNADSVDGLQTKIAELKAQRDVELTKIQEWRLTDTDPSQLIAITDTISPDLVEVFSNIRDNSDNYFSNTAGQEAKQRYDNIRIERDKLQNAAAKLEHRVEHIEQSKKENCPKCGYLWSPGVKEGELTNVQEQLA